MTKEKILKIARRFVGLALVCGITAPIAALIIALNLKLIFDFATGSLG